MDPSFTRRDFLKAMAAGTAALGAAPSRAAAARADPVVYLGTYTADTRSEGIYVCRMDAATGALRVASTAGGVENPSFLTLDAAGARLYAVEELMEFLGEKGGALSALAVDRATGGLTMIDRQPTHGGAPCYVTVDRRGRTALVANYMGGSTTVFPIRPDGGLAEPVQVVEHHGSGPVADRQEAAHVHSVTLDEANRFAVVADLGIDRLMIYRFDAGTGKLSAAPRPFVELAPGTGPRHFAFHPGGRRAYVVGELASVVVAFDYDPAHGTFRQTQRESILPADFEGENTAADLHLSADGRFLYASNRGHDSIAVFSIDPGDGRLTRVQLQPTGGRTPRNFALDPSGRFLLAANQASNDITTLRVDRATGLLSPTGAALSVPSPVCVRFAPAG
jgi:6-phosphogluconolactonase